jgi:cobalt/nickel transport system permease protein
VHVHFLDPYRPRASLIHRLDARVKLVLALAFILSCALTPNGAWPAYILLLALALAGALLSELGVGFVLKRAALALPFVLAALPLVFTAPGERLLSLQLGAISIGISGPGLERFLSIGLKSWISVQAAILLASSTPFPDLLAAMRAVRIPRLLVAIFGLMWRYLFVLVDEVLRLTRARAARSGHSDRADVRPGGGWAWRARVTGGMAGNLFMRALERSDRIYMAMVSRGYDGEVRTTPLPSLGAVQWVTLACGLAFLILLQLFSYFFWG